MKWCVLLVVLLGVAVQGLDERGLAEGTAWVGDEPEEAEEASPQEQLERSAEEASSEPELKKNMESTIQKAMADKKADLLQKASAAADDETEKAAREAARKKSEQKQDEGKEEDRVAKAKHQAEIAKSEAETHAAKASMQEKRGASQLASETTNAEERAKIATANRIAAEEKAKSAAALRLAAEEDAKKAAAIKATSEEQSEAAQKSPQELHALEAKAFKEAAALKVKEGEALGKMAALKKGTADHQAETDDESDKAKVSEQLVEAKTDLASRVSEAKEALGKAKAHPFDKKALQEVIDVKAKVEDAKGEVTRLSAEVSDKEVQIEEDKKHEEVDEDDEEEPEKVSEKVSHPGENGEEDPQHNEGSGEDGHGKVHETVTQMEDNNMKKDPETRHWTEQEIKYWANKPVKWTYEDPLNKNAVMGKIFQIKDMESQTLMKMNELKVADKLDPDGPNAKALADGHDVIMGGEIIRANPKFHMKHVFQGQKGRNPRADVEARDPDRDVENLRTFDQVMAGVGNIKAAADQEVARAQHARRPVRSFHDVISGKEAPDPVGPEPTLTQLKKAVEANKAIAGADPQKKIKEEVKAEEKEEAAPAKGADEEESLGETADGDNIENLAERQDEDAMEDDNDVSELMDENAVEDGIGDDDDA
jgi:hypothetical protein